MRVLLRLAVCSLSFLAGPALAQDQPADPAAGATGAGGKIILQLNKLEAAENACTAYMVVGNQSPEALKELKVDVYLFDKKGVILQGIALGFTDVGAESEMVVPFELPAVTCDQIGRVLLNKVLACTNANGAAVENCQGLVTASSLAQAPFDN